MVPFQPNSKTRNPYAPLIASCRRSAGLTRLEMGERVGVPHTTIALWEDPTYEGMDLPVLERVARAADRRLQVHFGPVRAEPTVALPAAPARLAQAGEAQASETHAGETWMTRLERTA